MLLKFIPIPIVYTVVETEARMGEEEEKEKQGQELNHPEKKRAALCEVCKEKEWKYRCPGCSLLSCSLPCVNSHKQRTACSGKRDASHFLPLSDFQDTHLLSDYYLLEEMKRVTDSSQRRRSQLGVSYHSRLPPHLFRLKKAAAARGTKLLLLSRGMSKRENNKSIYFQRNKCISWSIEWRFHSTDVILFDNRVREDKNLFSVIERHLQPGPWNHRLRQFCDERLDSLKLYIRKQPWGRDSPFCGLDIRAPLKQQLADVVILEYPVIYVFLPWHHLNFEIVQNKRPASESEMKRLDSNDPPSPKGVTFKVEKIEEENSDDQVCDIMSNANCSAINSCL